MNKIITTIVLIGMVLACKSKSENIEPEGKVACKILSHKGYYGGTYLGATGYNFSEIYLYDKTGNLIEFQNPPYTTKYEYNIKGNLLKAIQYTQYFQGPEIKSSETEYFYNADNQLIRQVNNELSWQYTEVLYEYHLKGRRSLRNLLHPSLLLNITRKVI